MSRNFILFTLSAVIVGCVAMDLTGLGGVALGDDTTTTIAVIQDTFDDNKQNPMWAVFGSSTTAKVSETGKHLQFTTSSDANETFVGYISNKWWIDPNEDFQMKADLHFDVSAAASGWVTLGFTPNSKAPGGEYVMVGIGRSRNFENYWWELSDDIYDIMDFVGRTLTTVTFYVSYDSANDILYLGDTGYGPENAWQTVPGFLRTYWGRVPLYVFLGVTTQNLDIAAGSVYIDNFAVQKGNIGSPYDSGDTDDDTDDDANVVADVNATVAFVPSTIDRDGAGTKITAVISLPKGVTLADWDSEDVPTLSPGSLSAGAQTAFLWVDKTVKVLASFNRTDLLRAVTADGETELYIVGTLVDGSTYAGSATITIK